jgi:hypothetical protein
MEINCGKGIVVDVNTDRFNDEVQSYIFKYGLRQMLSDVHSAEKKTDAGYVERSRALVNKKLASLYAGEFRAAGERTRLDPVEAEARRLCLADIQARLRKEGHKLNSRSTDWYAAKVEQFYERFLDKAEKIVAIRDEAEDDVDIDIAAD